MARFARDCMYKMSALTKMLEATLGPDTSELTLRMGLHSGPVTAGVLRGERSRFQLFGDTMNTAARIESTGKRSCIHLSTETANLLKAAGKSKWVKPREDKVYAKGKGEMTTFFLEINQSPTSGSVHSSEGTVSTDVDLELPKKVVAQESSHIISDKTARLIQWNFEVLSRPLKQIIARRNHCLGADGSNHCFIRESADDVLAVGKGHPIDEVKDIIELPDRQWSLEEDDAVDGIELDPLVADQLRDYLEKISLMYRENPFHNCTSSESK
jgi:hypothetical protein